MLVSSIFSFSHNVFYPSQIKVYFLNHIYFVVCNCFSIWTGSKSYLSLTAYRKKTFENIAGKEENAGKQHFLVFPQYFLPVSNQSLLFESHLFCRLQLLSIWTGSKFYRSVIELALSHTSPCFQVSAVQVFLKRCEKKRNYS